MPRCFLPNAWESCPYKSSAEGWWQTRDLASTAPFPMLLVEDLQLKGWRYMGERERSPWGERPFLYHSYWITDDLESFGTGSSCKLFTQDAEKGFFCTPGRKGGSQKQAPPPPLTWKMRINGEERRRARKRQSGLAVACAHQKTLKARKNKGGPFIINFSPPRKHRDGANYCQNVTPSPAASLSTELYPLGIRMMLNTVRWAHTYLYSVNHTGWCWILY